MGYSLSTTSPFLKGLNTELNKLVDSTEYTNDELNCMVRANNTRSRRPGLDYEELYKFSNEYLDLSKPDLAFQCIEWTDINSPDESETYTGYPYLVCQVGGKVIFFRNEGAPYSGHQEEYVLDLASYALDSSDAYTRERCKFTAAYGCIFITSKAIRPIYLRSAQNSEDPSLPEPTTPTGSCSVAVKNSKHGRLAGYGTVTLYLNGQSVGTCTIQDYNGGRIGNCYHGPWMLCSTQIADYWNSLSEDVTLGIIATPKYPDGVATNGGIYSPTMGSNEGPQGYWASDYVLFTAPEESGTTLKGTEIKIVLRGMGQSNHKSWDETLTYSCKLVGGSNYVYKDNIELTMRDTNVGASDYLAVDDTPTKMSYAHLYNLLNQGWTVELIAKFFAKTGLFPGNNLAQQMLKDEKTEAFKPDNYINMTFGNTPASRGHMVLDYFDQKRVTKSNLVNVFTQLITALNTETGTTKTFADYVDTSWDLEDATQSNLADAMSQVPDVKPRKPYCADICNYAGRIFYLSGDVLLYSQVIAEDITKADKCYTEADPTSESISDVIETDGGLISLPDIGEGIRLQPCGSSLLVFGTRGNMIISGTVNNIFTATAYGAGAINAVPTQAPDSFVSTEYGIFYWGTTGITFVTYGDNGVETKDISTERILTFYGKLTNDQHKYCKGIYSSSKKKIYWFYPSNSEMPRRLDLCLVYDIQRDAYAPQKIVSQDDFDGESSTQTPEVVSGTQLKVPFKSVKEYPLYADRIVPEDTKEFLYMKAEGNYEQTSEDPNWWSNYPAQMSPQGIFRSDAEGHTCHLVGNKDFMGVTDYDLVVKLKYDDSLSTTTGSVNNVGGIFEPQINYASAAGYTPIVHLITTEENKLAIQCTKGYPRPRSADLTLNNYVWVRITYHDSTDTTTVRYFQSATDDYTFDTIGSATEWTTLTTFSGTAFRDYPEYDYELHYWSLSAPQDRSFKSIGYIDAFNCGDLVSGWRFSNGIQGTNLDFAGGNFTEDGKIITPDMWVRGRKDFKESLPYDFVLRVRITQEPSSEDDSAIETKAYSQTSTSSGSFLGIHARPVRDVGVFWYAYVPNGRPNGAQILVEAGKTYWLRTTGDGSNHSFRVIEEGDTPYTFDNIANHPAWATATTRTWTGSYYAFKYASKWILYAPTDKAGAGSFVDVVNSGDLATGWHFVPPKNVTLYYNSVTPDAHAYFDSAMTDDAGLLSNYFNDGHRYTKTAYYNLTREDDGVDKVMVQKPWQGVDGLKEDAFFVSSDADSFVNGTKTTAEDDRVYSTVDANEYFYENGRIYYDAVPLTQETALESQLYNWNVTYTGAETGTQEIVDDDGYKVLADEPLDTEEFTYESSILLCLDPSSCKVTFGDFRNNYMRDWAEGDQQGDGYLFDSYMISHPVNVGDFVRQKSMPYLIGYFKRSETGKTTTGEYLYGSKCQGSVRWDWRTDGLNSKWDRPNELYRPDKRTLLSQGYIITRTNIRGLGRSFQVKVQGVEDNNFIVEAFAFDLQHDERV